MRAALQTRRDGPSAQDKLEVLHRQPIEAVADLVSYEAWMRMLRGAARDSPPPPPPPNVLLITARRPDATRVSGIRTWNSLGRHVSRGERGIPILALCIHRPMGSVRTLIMGKPLPPTRRLTRRHPHPYLRRTP